MSEPNISKFKELNHAERIVHIRAAKDLHDATFTANQKYNAADEKRRELHRLAFCHYDTRMREALSAYGIAETAPDTQHWNVYYAERVKQMMLASDVAKMNKVEEFYTAKKREIEDEYDVTVETIFKVMDGAKEEILEEFRRSLEATSSAAVTQAHSPETVQQSARSAGRVYKRMMDDFEKRSSVASPTSSSSSLSDPGESPSPIGKEMSGTSSQAKEDSESEYEDEKDDNESKDEKKNNNKRMNNEKGKTITNKKRKLNDDEEDEGKSKVQGQVERRVSLRGKPAPTQPESSLPFTEEVYPIFFVSFVTPYANNCKTWRSHFSNVYFYKFASPSSIQLCDNLLDRLYKASDLDVHGDKWVKGYYDVASRRFEMHAESKDRLRVEFRADGGMESVVRSFAFLCEALGVKMVESEHLGQCEDFDEEESQTHPSHLE